MRKVLVANRGEIACRIFRACRANGIASAAVCSDADAGGLHAESADEVVRIGPANPRESYLVAEKILDAARRTGADAIHPGYGFLAENADFAEAVESAGLTWVGPRPQSIRDMGNKARAREIAARAGVPVLPGTGRVDADDPDQLIRAAEQVGFPLLVKAAAGGGGIGMRAVEGPDKLAEAVKSTSALAARAFGDGDVFLEKHVARARHVEAQIFGDGAGGAAHFGERECSIQRRFQKIIEESPSPGISGDARARMCDCAVALAQGGKYRGAGTVEFIYDDDGGEFYFLEMNTRIQVEHPVTEMVWGADLVGMQLRLAGGGEVPELRPDADGPRGADGADGAGGPRGHAIECRLCAEDPAKMFLPSPGVLEVFRLPSRSDDVRVDAGYREGDRVTPFYDSLLAKIIVRGEDRSAAAEKMSAALAEVRIEGARTNLDFLSRCVAHPAFRAGETTTDFIARHRAALI